jgi:hypothetical protein
MLGMGLELDGELVAVVERKRLGYLAELLVGGQLPYRLAELASLPRAAVVVEDRYADLFQLTFVSPNRVAQLLTEVTVRYPSAPIVFCETRPLAEAWTFRFLGTALSYVKEERGSGNAAAPTPGSDTGDDVDSADPASQGG